MIKPEISKPAAICGGRGQEKSGNPGGLPDLRVEVGGRSANWAQLNAYLIKCSLKRSMTFVMVKASFSSRIVRRVDNPQEFLVTDLAL